MIDLGPAPTPTALEAFAASARRDGRDLVVGAVIVDPSGRVFVQRRAETRAIFPGAWDLVGGHVADGESLEAALAREIDEETGWRLASLGADVLRLDWEANGRAKREIDLLVRVDGDPSNPRLEAGKHTEFRWLEPDEIGILLEARDPDDTFVWEVVRRAFVRLGRLDGAMLEP